MERFDIHILGCGSASPTSRHFPSSQVINHNDRLFMFDCGEGSQMQFRNMKLKFSRLNHIFISHLHGDHCFGLIGLISTLGLLGRSADLFVYAHPDAETLFAPLLQYFCKDLPFKVKFVGFSPQRSDLLYEDKRITVRSIPLKHRVPTAGFLLEEKPRLRHIIKEMADYYQVPLSSYLSIKEGCDYTHPESGEVIPNGILTTPSGTSLKYAYCSDTAYTEKIIPYIEGVDLLYHEATFAADNLSRAKETFHSTAAQAAQMAIKANVKQLLIGHFSARYNDERVLLEEAKKLFPNTVLANDGMTLSLR
ncbi:MAG: ribonuclease Z [Bacteroidales bacterium]